MSGAKLAASMLLGAVAAAFVLFIDDRCREQAELRNMPAVLSPATSTQSGRIFLASFWGAFVCLAVLLWA